MFGQNQTRKKEMDSGLMQVHDVWYTLQGEGPFGGLPAVFLRVSGCTLACFWCDTEWDDRAAYRPVADIVAEAYTLLELHSCDLLVITGGEPLRHQLTPFLEELFARARVNNKRLVAQVETSGSIADECLFALTIPHWRPETNHGLYVVCSPKTPTLNPMVFERADCFKYVVSTDGVDEEDGLPIVSTQVAGKTARIARPRAGIPVYVSPCDTHEETTTKANYALAGRLALQHGYRLSLQMHKHVEQP